MQREAARCTAFPRMVRPCRPAPQFEMAITLEIQGDSSDTFGSGENQTSFQPGRYSRRMIDAASGAFGQRRLTASHSIFLPTR